MFAQPNMISTACLQQSRPDRGNYRPDIDGLRALAVLPVLFFHAKLGCPGGYVGVDVFFVISGYLICTLINKELAAGTFSLSGFWERRIRRILPAMTVMVLATLIAGVFLYLPQDFESVGKSVVAQAMLLSNLFFYRQPAGYFDAGVDTKPLLHTWSLAVEEQFYLIFPLLLLFLARSRKFSFNKTIVLLALGSLALSIVGVYLYPSATFYLLPTRAWELLIGAWLAMSRGRFAISQATKEATGWVGLGCVCVPLFLYSGNTRFPGLAAMPPCLGATLIIFSSESALSVVGRLLAFKPVVFIGLISYSLYLWHWPLLVFLQYLTGDQRWPFRAAMLAVSFALAIISWKYVETPFRKRRVLPQRSRIFGFAGVSFATLLILGLAVSCGEGLPARFSDKALSYANSRNHYAFRNATSLEQARAGHFVELGMGVTNQPISVLIWGDSHAMGVTPVIDELCRRFSQRGIQAAEHGVPPILKSGKMDLDVTPQSDFANAVLSFIVKKHVRNVIITAHWKFYARRDSFEEELVSTIRSIMEHSNARVYVLKDIPDQKLDVPRIAALATKYGYNLDQIGISREEHHMANRQLLRAFERISQMGATVLDSADYFLNSKGLYGALNGDQVLYTDGNHLTVEGARLLAPLFEPIFHVD